ncbi:MAG: hypothetical protein WBV82_28525, partial [Myxococcaceae bacterium]
MSLLLHAGAFGVLLSVPRSAPPLRREQPLVVSIVEVPAVPPPSSPAPAPEIAAERPRSAPAPTAKRAA